MDLDGLPDCDLAGLPVLDLLLDGERDLDSAGVADFSDSSGVLDLDRDLDLTWLPGDLDLAWLPDPDLLDPAGLTDLAGLPVPDLAGLLDPDLTGLPDPDLAGLAEPDFLEAGEPDFLEAGDPDFADPDLDLDLLESDPESESSFSELNWSILLLPILCFYI